MSTEPAVDLKKNVPQPDAKAEKEVEKGLSNDALTKYTTAGQALGDVLKKFIPQVVAGKKVLDLCIEGDKLVAETVAPLWNKAKNGSAFPTSISVNNVVSHVSPLPSDPEIVLKENDVVKIMLGIQLDGYAVTHAETVHLSSKTDGVAADVIKAAYDAAQLAMRTLKVGAKNWDVTEVVEKAAKDYGCVGVEGMLSCQHQQNVTDGKKRVLINPSPELKRDHETVTFDEGEVYGVDILVVSGSNGKAKADPSRTSIYKRATDVNYQLKMKTSRAVFSEIQKKAGVFPFTLRALDDEKRARMGVQEAVSHVALLPAGPLLLSPNPVCDKISSSKSLQDEELQSLIAQPLRAPKKKSKKTNGGEAKEETKA
ncbi:DNA-binding protein, 42 kDa [Kwoniella shandongensis]|uniref:DNA-binding protein, 42 kDa n=1 Tax=Kwoniella shandongensis TaxID=1734106 RepID=A0AAJ8LQK7_9TREE